MSNTQKAKRPSLAPKHTRGSDERTADALDEGIRLTVDDEEYQVTLGDLTAPIAKELRHHYGGSFHKLMSEIVDDPDIDTISAFVWLARRVRGDDVAFSDVEIGYSSMLADGFDIDFPNRLKSSEQEVDEHPEG